METDPHNLKNLIVGIYYAVVASIGGALGYVYRESRASRPIRLTKLLLSSCLAAFIGYHMIFVYQSIGLSPELIGALNGLTALLGVEFTLYLVERWVLKKFGVEPDDRLTEALLAAGWTPPSHSDSITTLPRQEDNQPSEDHRESRVSNSRP